MRSFYKVVAILAACLLVLGILLAGAAFACGVSAQAVDGAIQLGDHIRIPVRWWNSGRLWDDAEQNDAREDSPYSYEVDSLPAVAPGEAGDTAAAVRRLELSLGGGEFRIMTGDSFRVEVTGLPESKIHTRLDEDEWKVEIPHGDGGLNLYPDVKGTITVPEGCTVEQLEIELGAGTLTVEGLTATRSAEVSVGAGTLRLAGCSLANAELDCGLGELVYAGRLTGQGSIDCGMGNVTVDITGSPESFGAQVDCGLGNVHFLEHSWSGAGEGTVNGGAENFFEIDCGMGNVSFIVREG